jgi:adenosylcobalamin-dependent ribonucleoside-triphosphate reductase
MNEKEDFEKVITPWGEIGYITFIRTYSRKLKENNINSKTEELEDVIIRELNACEKQLGLNFTEEEKKFFFKSRMELKWSTAGRFMWQLGTKTVDKLGLPSLQNCSSVVVNSPIRPFTWAAEMLLLGSGVGYNIQKHNVYQLPKLKGKIKITRVDKNDVDFIVPDNREGWVKLLGKVLKCHFYSEKGFTYSLSQVRGKGLPIKSFGGVSSGPEDLDIGIQQIHEILNIRSKQKLRPVDCLDIMNIIGQIVVSGNVRRSAQIAIGDSDDLEFLKAKRWDLGNIPNWRAMSNNSIVCNNINDLPSEFCETYKQGEPYGLINLELSKKIGRTGEIQYPDNNVECYNPCAEQSLENFETCCLGEIFLPNIKSYDEFLKCLTMSYKVCKHSLNLPCSIKETEEIVHKNMRMGIGITGILQSTSEQTGWFDSAYKFLRNFDVDYSKLHGFPTSIKLTTIKPSGTLSLLAGVTPGIHPSPAGPYYIRRIRIASNSNLIDVCRKNGYPIEYQLNFDGSEDKNTMVISFPCKLPENTPIASKYGWKQQLEMIKLVQSTWSDNSVSCTVYYKKHELEDIKEYLKENYNENFKTLSFLLYNDHGFKQAPYETISKEDYFKLIKNVKPITSFSFNNDDIIDDISDCESGHCPIK